MTAVLGSIDMGAPVEAMEGALPKAGPAEPEQVVAGRYHIERFLGQGANKRVFLAEDHRVPRHVALAFIRRAAASQATMMRVRREVEHMARVSDHRNIVTVHDVGDDDGRTYIVCEYAPGGSLASHLARLPDHRMALADALAVAEEITAALAHAHHHAIVHRDVKPGNVFLNARGEALLGDFGLALARDDVRLTDEYALVGTAPYMAPEQARGHPIDVRSDLYSLGVVLFELLCGRLPFMGKDALEILAKASFQQPRPSVSSHREVPAELDLLVKRLMAADPAERPSSAAEVRDRLAAMLPSAGSVSTSRPKADQVRLPPALASSRQWPFVGRAEHLAALHANWRHARAGHPSAAFVCGNAGAGKTRLCAKFAQEAHALGATVVYGRCDEETLAPYGPFIQAVRQYATYCPWLPGLVDLPTGFELARLGWPFAGDSPRPPPSTSAESRDMERYRFFEAAVAMVRAMADATPLVVIFDDLQWADIPTLRLLRHLVRFVGEGSVMLVCAMRDDEPKPDPRREQALEELQREAVVETMRLEGLSEDETAALVERWAPDGVELDLIARLRDRTGGNPFYIEETLRRFERDLAQLRSDLAEPRLVSPSVPKAIEALILRRVQPPAISPATREALDTAAIIGREFGPGLLASVLGRSVPEVTDALDEAIRAGLVIEVPGQVDQLAFCHAYVRETLLGRQQPSQRMELHARCGQALEARYASSGPHAAELAHHFFEARHDHRDQALRYTVAAAAWASGALAYEDAVTQQDRALEILTEQGRECDAQRCDLLLARGRALWRAGETGAARDSFVDAANVARQLDDAERFARAAAGFGRRYYQINAVDEQLVALLQEALERIGEDNIGWRARILAALAESQHFRKPPDELQKLGREAVLLAEADGDPGARIAALAGLHAALLHSKFLEERLLVNQEMLELIGDHGPPERKAQGLTWRLYNLFELGDMETARREHAKLTELAQRLRQPIYLHFAAAWEAKWMETAGRFAEAEKLARRSQEFAKESNMDYADSNYAGQLFGLRRDQGLLRDLPKEVHKYIGERPRVVVWRAGMLLARLDAGERDRAREEFESLARRDFAEVPPDLFWLGATCLLAEACCRLADRERARVLYRILKPYKNRNAQIGLALSVGIVHRFLGGLAAVQERWSIAERHFNAALERSAAMDAATSLAHIRCEYAEMLLARGGDGDRARAAEHLAEARRAADRLGMKPLADRAATLERGL
jgi:eukaryotic-like serine/threonine-protein kinase